MIATIKYIAEQMIETVKFVSAVWHDARSLQHETEQKYGHIGF